MHKYLPYLYSAFIKIDLFKFSRFVFWVLESIFESFLIFYSTYWFVGKEKAAYGAGG